MWTAIITVLVVLYIIDAVSGKKKAPTVPPSAKKNSASLPKDSDATSRSRSGPQVITQQQKTTATLFDEVIKRDTSIPSEEGALTLEQAEILLANTAGLKDFLLTRYALTGSTRIYPALGSDLHHAFLRLFNGEASVSFLRLNHFNWDRALHFDEHTRKDIRGLYHFTSLSNLKSILDRGILTRSALEKSEISFSYNDQLRLEGVKDSVSLSLGHVNNKMLYKYSMGLSDTNWVILKIRTELLAGPNQLSFDHVSLLNQNLFCASNAASAQVTALSLQQRQNHSAFLAMFSRPGSPDNIHYPVDVQAEILHLGNIPSSFISELIFMSEQSIPHWLDKEKTTVTVNPAEFSYREMYG
ncbi:MULTISPECIES: DarT ssDNA thymidine ADP-ribosyltransferase family protein [Franconibacter]|uniref:DarT ssDNA thymidine ADP-ribosyltransferase family protein n=1 Tax=Franconibacter daqui TaxID=2047724 RepID=A0ABV1PJX8_9ENTR|nr:DarT ssDNA thymidine ADP-ribosyltransferase family protein [Franconibacter sp. IITDAS19]MCK1968870.1 DUF4433 domain-containing protein [Franconibacter sp. IITDAS19]